MDLIAGAKIVLIAYLLVLAGAAALGAHRALLAYPLYLGYSLIAFVLYAVSFGRLRLARARNFSSRQRRRLRSRLRDWRDRRAEEAALARGEEAAKPMAWHSAASEAPGAPQRSEEATPAPETPLVAERPDQPGLPTLDDFISGE